MSLPSTLVVPEKQPAVLRIGEVDVRPFIRFFADKGLELVETPAGEKIPGTFWGEPEAGLLGSKLYYRADTPVHSVPVSYTHLTLPTNREV